MVSIERLATLAPHYLAMLVLVVLTVAVVRVVLQGESLAVELVAVLGVVFLYPFAIRRLGYAPDVWE